MQETWGAKKDEVKEENKGKKNDCNGNEFVNVEKVNNRIYYYAEIERGKILQLNKQMRELDAVNISDKENRELISAPSIFLHINSYGGSIFAGLSGTDNILQCKSDVITIVDGICASAATFLSVVGKKRLITSHSCMLIHQLSSMMWGKYGEIKDEVRNLDLLMKIIKGLYMERTKLPEKKLDDILKKDMYFDAKTCVKYGLVDEII